MSGERLEREDLERFHDGALEGAERERVAARLREDPGARARLARVRDLDAMTRRVLLGEEVGDASEEDGARRAVVARVGWGRVGRSVLAACAVVVAGVGVTLWGLRPSARSVGEGGGRERGAVVVAPGTEGDASASERAIARREGVLVMRVTTPAGRAQPASAPEDAHAEGGEASLLALVGEGSLAEAFDAARRHSGALSDDVMAALGERVRSGELAREFLESLPAERQAQAVRVWAGNPHLRPAAFGRLRELLQSSDEAARHAGERARADLETRPDLATWVASFARTRP